MFYVKISSKYKRTIIFIRGSMTPNPRLLWLQYHNFLYKKNEYFWNIIYDNISSKFTPKHIKLHHYMLKKFNPPTAKKNIRNTIKDIQRWNKHQHTCARN